MRHKLIFTLFSILIYITGCLSGQGRGQSKNITSDNTITESTGCGENEKNLNSLSFSRGVVRPGVAGQENLLVTELGQGGSARPVDGEADLDREAGPQAGPKLE